MKKVLVLGTGAQGSTAAQRLDEEPNVSEIICADYDKKAVDELVKIMKKGKGVQLDASKKENIVAVAQGVDLIVNALPLDYGKNVLETAIEVKSDYQDFAACEDIADPALGDDQWVEGIKIMYDEYGKRFKNAHLRYLFANYMAPGYNLMSMLYMLSHVMNKDGGVPIGGSTGMSKRMAEYYEQLGGIIRYNSEAERIIVENDRAVGVELKNGVKLSSDWVVSSTAAEHCLKKLLGGAYKVNKMEKRWADRRTYPIYTMTIAAFKCSKQLSQEDFPVGLHGMFKSPVRVDRDYPGVAIRNYSYDPTLKCPDGCSVVQAQIIGDDDMYFWWKERKADGTYKAEKQRIASELIERIYERYPELEGSLETIDVITPMTYERYLNTRHGSFQGFVHTSTGKALMQKGTVPGLNGFILSGQCIFQSGGLPPAVITGRFAAQRICRADGRKFMEKKQPLVNPIALLTRKKDISRS